MSNHVSTLLRYGTKCPPAVVAVVVAAAGVVDNALTTAPSADSDVLMRELSRSRSRRRAAGDPLSRADADGGDALPPLGRLACGGLVTVDDCVAPSSRSDPKGQGMRVAVFVGSSGSICTLPALDKKNGNCRASIMPCNTAPDPPAPHVHAPHPPGRRLSGRCRPPWRQGEPGVRPRRRHVRARRTDSAVERARDEQLLRLVVRADGHLSEALDVRPAHRVFAHAQGGRRRRRRSGPG